MKPLAQFIAVFKYEIKMQWRRRALLVVSLGAMVVPALFTLLMPEGSSQLPSVAPSIYTWGILYLVSLAILPAVTADTVPKDRVYGTQELFDGLPLRPSVYLAGKLIGTWGAAAIGITAAGIANGVLWWSVVGPLDLHRFAEMLILGGASMVLLNGGLGVLLAASQPNRRRAIAVGIAVILICVLGLIASFNSTSALLDSLNPARPALFNYYFFGQTSPGLGRTATLSDVWLTLGVGAAELAAVWLIVLHLQKESVTPWHNSLQ